MPAIVVAPFLLALFGSSRCARHWCASGCSTSCWSAARSLVLAAQLVRGRSLVGSARRVLDRRRPFVRRGDRRPLLRLPPGRARPVSRRPPVRGAFVLLAVIARRSAPRAGAVPRRGDRADDLGCFSSSPRSRREFANRIQERNTFVVAPFFLIALSRLGRPQGCRARAGVAVAAAVTRCAAPARDPVRAVHRDGRDLGHARAAADLECVRLAAVRLDRLTVLAGACSAAALFLFVPRRWALALPAVDARRLRSSSTSRRNVWSSASAASRQASVGRALSGDPGRRERLDRPGRSEGRRGGGRLERRHGPLRRQSERVLQPQVGPIYYIGGADPGRARGDGGDDRRERRCDPDRRRASHRRSIRARRGRRSRPTASCWRRDPGHRADALARRGPLVATATRIEGLYPGDTWSGRPSRGRASAAAAARSPSRSRATRSSSTSDQVVTASVAGERRRAGADRARRARARLRVRPTPERRHVPGRLPRSRGRRCPGGGDDRELGAHFNTFDYRP